MTKTLSKSSPTKLQLKTRGSYVARWIEANCVLGEGDYFGEQFVLRSWQKDFLKRLYALNPDGTKRYRRALLGLPKGNGKTPLAAAITAYELFGPDRIDPIIAVG